MPAGGGAATRSGRETGARGGERGGEGEGHGARCGRDDGTEWDGRLNRGGVSLLVVFGCHVDDVEYCMGVRVYSMSFVCDGKVMHWV